MIDLMANPTLCVTLKLSGRLSRTKRSASPSCATHRMVQAAAPTFSASFAS